MSDRHKTLDLMDRLKTVKPSPTPASTLAQRVREGIEVATRMETFEAKDGRMNNYPVHNGTLSEDASAALDELERRAAQYEDVRLFGYRVRVDCTVANEIHLQDDSGKTVGKIINFAAPTGTGDGA